MSMFNIDLVSCMFPSDAGAIKNSVVSPKKPVAAHFIVAGGEDYVKTYGPYATYTEAISAANDLEHVWCWVVDSEFGEMTEVF